MSDSEDRDIWNEIKALEDALAIKADISQQYSCEPTTHVNINTLLPTETSIKNVDNNQGKKLSIPIVSDDACYTGSAERNAFELNKRLIESLSMIKDVLTSLLEECKRKLELIDNKLEQHTKSSSISRNMISLAGMPYFKDKSLFSASKNEDAKLKTARGELQIVHLCHASRWTPKDRNMLLRAIRQEAIVSILDNRENNELYVRTVASNTTNKVDKYERETTAVIPRNFKEMIGPLGKKEFDWLKIAAMDFDGKHSAEECRVMWNVFLHPDINKSRWTKLEDLKLNKVAKNHNFQNWDMIAKILNTNRTGYQCFIRHNTSKKIKLKGSTWSVQEDKKLCNLIVKLKIGNFVPWGEVAGCMGNRTKQQVYFRWMYSLAPHLKKGRFTTEEDKMLLEAVMKFGRNFSKISAVCMPHRSTIQLSDHYHTLTSRENLTYWTLQDDIQLIKLYNQYGSNWAEIAKKLPSKNRVQVRHRHAALTKYLKKGISVYKIPRPRNQNYDQYENSNFENNIYTPIDEPTTDKIKSDTIEKRLIEHFQFALAPKKVGRKQKLYRDDQLSENTKKIYNILKALNAHLSIPDNFDNNLHLNQKERQLLGSLREYIKTKTNLRKNTELIEKVRMKMFAHQSDTEENSHFIPPLPFGGYFKKSNNNQTPSIDYNLDTSKKFTIEMTMKLETSDFIIDFIGGIEEERQFQKLNNILYPKGGKVRNGNVIEKVYIIPFQMSLLQNYNFNQCCNNTDMKNEKLFTSSRGISNPSCKNKVNHNLSSIDSVIPKAITNIYNTENYTLCETTREFVKMDSCFTTIEPSSTTLLAFQNLLSLQQVFDVENVCQSTQSHTKRNESMEYQNAYDLLKHRLLQLFKYPVGMSHILPQICGKDNTLLRHNDSTIKRKEHDVIETSNKKFKVNYMN